MRERATTTAEISLPTLYPTTASSSNPELCSVQDPVSKAQLGASLNRERHARHLSCGSGKPWEREPDKYVMEKCFRPGYDENSRFKVVVSETPVLITHLRLCEQNVAYEALLAKAPMQKVTEYYTLHLSRLAAIREALASDTVVSMRGAESACRDNIAEGSSEPEETEKIYEAKRIQREKVESAFRAYKEAIKRRERLKANERGVVRLLVMCERMMGGEEGG